MFSHRLKKIASHWGQPAAWRCDQTQPLQGQYAKNERLAGLMKFASVKFTQKPESIAIDQHDYIYASFENGHILKFNPLGDFEAMVVNTGGRPLGLRFHPDGDLLVCDANLGLLKVNVQTAAVSLLSNMAEGVYYQFTDDLDVSKDGSMIYFTDASSRWPFGQDHLEIIEHRGNGRLLSYNCNTGETTVLMRGLVFANGVSLNQDESAVMVTETGRYRVHRYWLTGAKAGQSEIWIDNLPGMPDNIRFNGQDCYWIAIPHLRSTLLDFTAPYPQVRWLAMLYAHYLPIPAQKISCVLGFNSQGELIHNLQSHDDECYHFITQALEHKGHLYCSSLKKSSIARLNLQKS